MSRLHTFVAQWGLVSGIRQDASDLIDVVPSPSRFSPEARKGQLIVTVEAEGDVSRGRAACAVVTQAIREGYYTDGAASITSSLRKALKNANAALYQFNFEAPPHKRATVGVSCAVFHGHDLYIAQVAPAQAYVAHAGKLRGVPNPISWTGGAQGGAAVGLSSALGTSLGAEPEFFRSVLQPGDSVVLVSSNISRLLSKNQAEQLICFSDATTIAETLLEMCRRSHLPEAHAVVIEIMPELSAAARHAPLSPVGVSERGRLVADRIGDWFSSFTVEARRTLRGNDTVATVTPDVDENGTEALTQPPRATQQVAPPESTNGTVIAPSATPVEQEAGSLLDRVPIGDVDPLPPSAFIGESTYGGVVRPPAVKREQAIDLTDNDGVPVDFAALPKKASPPPLSLGERLTLPIRAVLVYLLGGMSNVRRRTQRPLDGPATRPMRTKIRGLSYRRERPPIPWFNVLLLGSVFALLVIVGIQQNRRRDQATVQRAIQKVEDAVVAAESAPEEGDAQSYLRDAESALRELAPLQQSGLLTVTRTASWASYQRIVRRYDRARATINRIGVFGDITPIATLPLPGGQTTRVVLATDPDTPNGLVENRLYVLDRGNDGGTVYALNGDGLEPILAPGQEAGTVVAARIRELFWRDDAPMALDRDENPFNSVATAYLSSGTGWLANRLQGSELLPLGELVGASYGGNLYLWDSEEFQLMRYASGMYADLPTPWISDRGSASLDQVVGIQIDGTVYILRSDGSVVVFSGGTYQRTLPVPQLSQPVQTITRFYVTPDVIDQTTGEVIQIGHIFLLDTLNERVIQIEKSDGTVVQQIQAREPGQLNRLMDLQVDAARNLIYLANGDQILRATIPDPPSELDGEPEPSSTPQATDTPEP
jgi:hypothetical protein